MLMSQMSHREKQMSQLLIFVTFEIGKMRVLHSVTALKMMNSRGKKHEKQQICRKNKPT